MSLLGSLRRVEETPDVLVMYNTLCSPALRDPSIPLRYTAFGMPISLLVLRPNRNIFITWPMMTKTTVILNEPQRVEESPKDRAMSDSNQTLQLWEILQFRSGFIQDDIFFF